MPQTHEKAMTGCSRAVWLKLAEGQANDGKSDRDILAGLGIGQILLTGPTTATPYALT